MRPPAPDAYLLSGLPPYAINAYLVGDVLIDARSRHARRRILRQLRGHTVSAHADHQGSSHAVCDALGIPLWCGELDVAAAEDGRIRERMPDHPINDLIARVFPGPGHPVARRLRERDEVAGFQVLDRASMRRLAATQPALVCFGHGRPLRDPAKLAAFTAGLPQD